MSDLRGLDVIIGAATESAVSESLLSKKYLGAPVWLWLSGVTALVLAGSVFEFDKDRREANAYDYSLGWRRLPPFIKSFNKIKKFKRTGK